MDIRLAPTVPGEVPPWKTNPVAKAPALSGETARRSPLSLLRLPGALLANAARIHPDSSSKGIKHRWKFFVRGLATPQLTQSWFELWQTPKLSQLLAGHPRMLLKLQRPYSQRGLGAKERWEILRQHYSFVVERFPAGVLREIFTGAGALLATLPPMEAGHFSLRLFYDNLFEKEGEVSLVFYEEQKQRPLFALTFCVSCGEPGRREIFIGGLQGYKTANVRECIVSITRGMFGLRPKALLLFALQQCAAPWNIRNLRAASNETRVRRGKTSIKADYDTFWLDSGGRLEADGNFALPVVFTARESAEIRPNKRAMYRRRYLLLDHLGSQIRQNVSRLEGSILMATARAIPRDGSIAPAQPKSLADCGAPLGVVLAKHGAIRDDATSYAAGSAIKS